MAKSRRKSGGATRGRLKLKKMGKGWLSMRKQRGSEKPIDRSKSSADAGNKSGTAATESSGS